MHSAIPSADTTSRLVWVSVFIYGAWTLFTKKGRRLDAEIKRMQNASFYILVMATSVMYYEKAAVGANAFI
jgi:hypothetical protein